MSTTCPQHTGIFKTTFPVNSAHSPIPTNLFPHFLPIPLQLCVSSSTQLNLLVNVRGVSHGSPPYLPVPAVLFISSVGENEGYGFFRVRVTHSIWQQTMRHSTVFFMPAQKTVAFRLDVQKQQQRLKQLWVQFFFLLVLFFSSFSVVEAEVQELNCHLSIHGKR